MSCAPSIILGLRVFGDGFKYNRSVITSSRHIDRLPLRTSDRKALGWTRPVTNNIREEDEDILCDGDTPEDVVRDPTIHFVEREPASRRISVVQSSVLYTFYRHHSMTLTFNTGATTNMIWASTARLYNLPIAPASHIARQADGVTALARSNVARGSLSFNSMQYTVVK